MGSLDVDSLFTIIPLEETIEVCTNQIFKESETIEGLSNSEFKEFLSLITKNSYFIMERFYKQIDGVTMGPPLDTLLANAFLAYNGKNWLERCTFEYRPFFYRRYVDDEFVLFNSPEHLKRYVNKSFTMENERRQRNVLS